jgi:hypothetical protein
MDDVRRMADDLMRGELPSSSGSTVVYPRSRLLKGNTGIILIRRSEEVVLLAAGSGTLFDELPGEAFDTFKLAPLCENTRRVINRHFPHTLPAPAGRLKSGIGLGDRIGLASPGHIRAVRERVFSPYLPSRVCANLPLPDGHTPMS